MLVSKSPMGKNALVDSNIVIKFSEEMRKESVKIEIDGVQGSILWLNNTVLFIPIRELSYSTSYKVKLSGTDLYNNSVELNEWTFSTENKPQAKEKSSGSMTGIYISIIIVIVLVIIFSIFSCYRRMKKGCNF
jgi:hypothetical protein